MDIRITVYEDHGVFLHGISIAVGVIIVFGEFFTPFVLTQQNHPTVSVDIGFFTGIVLRKDTFYRLKRAFSYRNIPYAKRIPGIFRGDRISVFGFLRRVFLYENRGSDVAVSRFDSIGFRGNTILCVMFGDKSLYILAFYRKNRFIQSIHGYIMSDLRAFCKRCAENLHGFWFRNMP